MDIADGQSSGGWVFLRGTTCPSFQDCPAPFYLHQVYQACGDPDVTTRLTVPLLWDNKERRIVSNDSWSMLQMLACSFAPLGRPAGDTALLMPRLGFDGGAMERAMEECHAGIYRNVLNGVYRSGVTLIQGNRDGAAAAARDVKDTLDRLEAQLGAAGAGPFLLGDKFSAVDVRLSMSLLRYDAAYLEAFGLRDLAGCEPILLGTEEQYPALRTYLRTAFPLLGSCTAIDWSSFRQYYRWSVGLPRERDLPDLRAIAASASKRRYVDSSPVLGSS